MTMRLAVTVGDPAGIGPEVVLKALARTDRPAAEMPTKILHAGFQAHLPKPVEPAQLVQAVAALAFKERQ